MTALRRAILQRLARGYADTSDLCRAAACSATDVQTTLRRLAADGLITAERALTPRGYAALRELEGASARAETR